MAYLSYLQRAQPEIKQIRYGERISRSPDSSSHLGSTRGVRSIDCLPTDEGSAGYRLRATTVAMFLEEFDAWREYGTS